MRRGRTLILIAIILLLGVLAAYLFLRPTEEPPPPEEEGVVPGLPSDMTFVVIAGQDISRGAIIPAQDGVVVSQMPEDLVVETMIHGPDEEAIKSLVVGRRARMDIARGVFITEGMLTGEPGELLGVGSDASMAIEPGFTAIAIPLTRLSGVAYALRPGDSVDVLVTFLMVDVDTEFQSRLPNQVTPIIAPGGTPDFAAPYITMLVGLEVADPTADPLPPLPYGKITTDPELDQPIHFVPQEQQRPRLVSQRLVEKATVLHVGTESLEDIMPQPVTVPEQGQEGGQQPAEPVPAEQKPPDIITLIVTPQDALAINWAIKRGIDLVLTLRAPGDNTITETTSVTLQYFLDNYNITVPTKLPYVIEPPIDRPIVPVLPNDTKDDEK
jgi:Flp pilus assembly protein CpaB